jgi:molybdenum cofactor biosynthesis enzyme MoaA
MIERISIEPSRRCSKGCAFCYNGSNAEGDGEWTARDVVALATDAAAHGVKAISFGGGEPLEWPEIFDVLATLRGVIFRSLTTNGLPLDACINRLADAAPDKVHVSIHAPENAREVERVIRQVRALAAFTKSGVNLLVRRSRLEEARLAARALHDAGIGNERIVYLPMRGPGTETPSPDDVAQVADASSFQSMTCLAECGKSPRFASIAADRTAAWCSYTRSRRKLTASTFSALARALRLLDIEPCSGGLVSITRRR